MKKLRDVLEDMPINTAGGGAVAGLGNDPPVGKRRNPQLFGILRRVSAQSAKRGKKSVDGRR